MEYIALSNQISDYYQGTLDEILKAMLMDGCDPEEYTYYSQGPELRVVLKQELVIKE